MAAPKEAAKHPKKSVAWNEDPEIMKRLEMVANLMLNGATNPNIAEALDVALRTAARDVSRVKQLWRKQSENSIEDKRAASLATYREIKMRLWKEFRKLDGAGKSTVKVLMAISDVEGEITKIEGTRIQTIDLTSKGEKITDPRGWSDAELAALLSAPSK